MDTDVSGDMGGDDTSLRAGADGLAQCGMGLDDDPSARTSPMSTRSLPGEGPPFTEWDVGCHDVTMVDAHSSPSSAFDGTGGPVFAPPVPAGINTPMPHPGLLSRHKPPQL